MSAEAQRIATRWAVRGSNSDASEIFRTRPYRLWVPPSLLYNGCPIPFPGVKRLGRGVHHPSPSSAQVKERVELYLYSPCEFSWSVLGRTLPFYLYPDVCSCQEVIFHMQAVIEYLYFDYCMMKNVARLPRSCVTYVMTLFQAQTPNPHLEHQPLFAVVADFSACRSYVCFLFAA